VLAEMAAGVEPNEKRRQAEKARRAAPTLRDGLALHVHRMRAKERRPASIETIEREVPRYLEDWLDQPLVEITRRDCRARHQQITEANGPYIANRVMRHLRAIWNTTDKERELPKAPTIGVHWNRERRRQEPIPWDELPAWRTVVESLNNEVRRDFNLFLLFTGLRRMDGATVRWEHLDLEAGTLHRPNPKGGADRAFTIPISAATVEILRRRRAENPALFPEGDAGWAFPTRATRDKDCHLCAELGAPPHRKMAIMHLAESKEQRVDRATGEVTQLLPSAHRLRDTYTSAAAECGGLSPFDIDVLTNHRPPRGSVTAGYVNLSMQHLAGCQDRVTAFLLSKMRPTPELRLVEANDA
jgi:integrase